MSAAPQRAEEPGGLHVVCAAAGMALAVPGGTSILDAVRDVGLAVPVACPDAGCGACETRVLEGVAEHHDAVLTSEERAVGETMMICVSRARTPSLVLDL